MFKRNQKDPSVFLSWGLNIEREECSMRDLQRSCKEACIDDQIALIVEAINAVKWFSGKWIIKQDGSLSRPDHINDKETEIVFREVVLSPVEPLSNIASLATFNKKQSGWEFFVDSQLVVILNSSDPAAPYSLMMNRNGFYLPRVRKIR